MKKKLLIGYTFAALSVIALVDCGTPESTTQSNKTKQEGKIKMTRKKTASGLEYKVITEGTGVSPQKGQEVTVHYTGWLDDNGKPGRKFDTSFAQDRDPLTFTIGVGQVIKGWDEGIALMKVGGKYRLIIPAELGYGARGVGEVIPPNATLIFDVELLGVK